MASQALAAIWLWIVRLPLSLPADTVGTESHCPGVAKAKSDSWPVSRADGRPFTTVSSKTTVNPDRIFEREFLNRSVQRPHCPTESKRSLRGLSSLCRSSPPLMPVIGIVIVKPPLSERLAGSHLSRDLEMHKHSLPSAVLLCRSWTRKRSACNPGWVVFLSANHKIRAVRDEDSNEEPKIHGSFWTVAAPIGYWFADHCRTPVTLDT